MDNEEECHVTASAKITSRGQVTIPKEIRETLHLENGDRLLFFTKHGLVHIERLPASQKAGSTFGILKRDDQEYEDLTAIRAEYRKERARRHNPSDTD